MLPATATKLNDDQSAAARALHKDVNIHLEDIWRQYFGDITRANMVQIAYGYPWKSRLGLIRMTLDQSVSFIGVNALLQHASVPEYVLITTIAHELAHYAHGFGSPLPRRYAHPHAGNVVNRELERRGLGEYTRRSDQWIDKYWFSLYDSERNSGWAGIPGSYRPTRHRHMPEP
jgi:hypothetical protein